MRWIARKAYTMRILQGALSNKEALSNEEPGGIGPALQKHMDPDHPFSHTKNPRVPRATFEKAWLTIRSNSTWA